MRKSSALGVVAVMAALVVTSLVPAHAIAPPQALPSEPANEAVRLIRVEGGWQLSVDSRLVAAHCVGPRSTCFARTQSFYVEGTEGPEDGDDPSYVESTQGWSGPESRQNYWPGDPIMPLVGESYTTPEPVDNGGPWAVYTHLRAVLRTPHGAFYGEWTKAKDPVARETPELRILSVDSTDINVTVGSTSLYMWNRECWTTCTTAIWGYSATFGGSMRLGSFSGVSGKVPHGGGYYGYTRLWAVLTASDPELAPFSTAKIAMPSGNPFAKIEAGVDGAAAAALIASRGVSAEELCLPLNTFRVSPGEPSVTNAYNVCDTTVRAQGTAAAVRQVAKQFGAAAVAVLLGAVQVMPVAPGQAPPPQPAPSPVDPPSRAPVWAGSPEQQIQRIEDSLRRRANASRPIPESSITYVATTCYEQAIKGGLAPTACEKLPIFLPGAEVWTAAAHDAEAIAAHPEWLMLTRGRARNSWYTSVPPCVAGTYDGTELACDEYPYGSALEGGPGASLKLVDFNHNRDEGSFLSGFFSNCRVPADGAYLVIPLIPPGTVTAPTVGTLTTSRACAP